MTATSTASTPQSERKVEELLGPDLALACVNGNASALARILGITPQAVWGWKKKRVCPRPKREEDRRDLQGFTGRPQSKGFWLRIL